MKRIEEFTAEELFGVYLRTVRKTAIESFRDVLDYIRANLDTGKREPMSVEEIDDYLHKIPHLYDKLGSSDIRVLAMQLKPLTVQQGFVPDWSRAEELEGADVCGWRPYVIYRDGSGRGCLGVPLSNIIPRPAPKMRQKTKEEKILDISTGGMWIFKGGQTVNLEDLAESTIDDLCRVANISLETKE